MKAFTISILASVMLCACGKAPNEAHQEQAHGHERPGIAFKEGKGLSVSSETGKMLGLKIADVTEGKTARRVDLSLRVFGSEQSNGRAFMLASGSAPANQLEFLHAGQEVRFGDGARGSIARIQPEASRFTGLAEVIVRLEGSTNIAPGTFLDGQVTIPSGEGVVVMPQSALLKTAEGHFAYVVNGDSIFRTKIEVGGREDGVVEVTNGLYAGDEVVLHPVMPLWLAELQAIRGGKSCADGH